MGYLILSFIGHQVSRLIKVEYSGKVFRFPDIPQDLS